MKHATLGFRVIATEAGRRLNILEHPVHVPPTVLTPAPHTDLRRLLAEDGRVAIVGFFYTGCITICSALGSEFQQLQAQVRQRGLGDKVRLISISFDPLDDSRALASYAEKLLADPVLWRFATVPDQAEREALLKAFGVVVIPTDMGQFRHNAALHVVSPDGRLRSVIDFDQPQAALEEALRLVHRPVGAP